MKIKDASMCSVGKAAATDGPNRDLLAERLGALAHPYRLQIIQELASQNCACCGDVVERLPIAQSTVSQHLKILAQADLVSVDTEGQKSLYRVNSEALGQLLHDVQSLKSCCTPRSEKKD